MKNLKFLLDLISIKLNRNIINKIILIIIYNNFEIQASNLVIY